MSNEERAVNAYKGLGRYYVAHQDCPPDADRSDRALRAVSGQLGQNPPFVEASFQVSDDPTAKVVATAISPKGRVAMVVVSGTMADRVVSFVTWMNGAKTSTPFNVPKKAGGIVAFGVFFPEGSEEPVVRINGSYFLWGNWTVELPWDMSVPKDSCLTAWVEDNVPQVAFIDKGIAWQYSPGKKGDWSDTYHWLGLVDGSLARIMVAEDGLETLYWRGMSFYPQMFTAKAKFVLGSISARDGGIQFVANVGGKNVSVWTDGEKRHDVPTRGWMLYDQGEIYGIECSGIECQRVMVFRKDRFVPFGESTSDFPVIGPNTGIGRFGDTIALWYFHQHEGPAHMRLCYVDAGGTVAAPRMLNDIACKRLHHGLGLLRKGRNDEPTLHWEVPLANCHLVHRDFPLYNVPFAALVPVEDERGKSVMAAFNPEGSATMVIVRYPLPKGK